MTPLQHANLSYELIKASGGLDEASRRCRVSKSHLSRYQTPESGHFMPADVIADLERACGDPIYSRALFEARPASAPVASLLNEGCEAAEAASSLQQEIRLATKDGQITEAERRRLARKHAHVMEEVRQVGDLLA